MSIRVYLAPQILSDVPLPGTIKSILHDLIDKAGGDRFEEINSHAKMVSICTVHASDATHAAIAADGRATACSPLYVDDAALALGLDSLVSSSPEIIAALENASVNMAWLNATTTLRDVLRVIFRHFAFTQVIAGAGLTNVLSFLGQPLTATVGSVPAATRNAVKNWMQNKGLATGWINNATTLREVVYFVATNLGWGRFKHSKEMF